MENIDEAHFVFNMDNDHTRGLRGVDSVNYADVVGGSDGFTMVLRLRGGTNARLEAPFIIFKNRDSNYPMMNLPDNFEGVSYRTQPCGWMENNVFLQWLQESRPSAKILMVKAEHYSWTTVQGTVCQVLS